MLHFPLAILLHPAGRTGLHALDSYPSAVAESKALKEHSSSVADKFTGRMPRLAIPRLKA
ncbi:hypothetical protein DYI23_14720 [Roseibium polysiphoniae]|uniref:Uncharacterized protein n=1 Tax=Roseibium polysiphoniae TaxID=2571221 RepID=A0A944CDK3_9HYPH|nr:hypothetical protein [Roseibium polysiphoniae]